MSEQEEKDQEKKEPESPYKAINRGKISTENAIKTLEKIMDVFGISQMGNHHVELACKQIEAGNLTLKNQEVFYKLSRAIEVHGEKKQQVFKLTEPNAAQMEDNGITLDSIVKSSLGISEEDDSDKMKTIARLVIGLPEEFTKTMTYSDIMILYGLHAVFFLG